jgi:hypothetical protein
MSDFTHEHLETQDRDGAWAYQKMSDFTHEHLETQDRDGACARKGEARCVGIGSAKLIEKIRERSDSDPELIGPYEPSQGPDQPYGPRWAVDCIHFFDSNGKGGVSEFEWCVRLAFHVLVLVLSCLVLSCLVVASLVMLSGHVLCYVV